MHSIKSEQKGNVEDDEIAMQFLSSIYHRTQKEGLNQKEANGNVISKKSETARHTQMGQHFRNTDDGAKARRMP